MILKFKGYVFKRNFLEKLVHQKLFWKLLSNIVIHGIFYSKRNLFLGFQKSKIKNVALFDRRVFYTVSLEVNKTYSTNDRSISYNLHFEISNTNLELLGLYRRRTWLKLVKYLLSLRKKMLF